MNMKAFPGLFLLVSVFWGYFTENIPLSVFLGIILESHNFEKFKFDFEVTTFKKIANINIILIFIGIAFYNEIISNNFFKTISVTLKFLPILFFPTFFILMISRQRKINLKTLLYSKYNNYYGEEIYLDYIYIFFFLLASSFSTNYTHEYFFISFTILVFILFIIQIRNLELFIPRASILILTFFSCFFINKEILSFYNEISNYFIDKLAESYQDSYMDPFSSNTSFGKIGKLNKDSKIIMRVYTENSQPMLLKKAIYDNFQNFSWVATIKNKELNRYIPNYINKSEEKIKITESNSFIAPIVAYPLGSLPLFENKAMISSLGTIQLQDVKGNFNYEIQKNTTNLNPDSPPQDFDLQIPPQENLHFALQEILKTFSDLTPLSFKTFFNLHYSYSLENNTKNITDFLTNTKTGHCEYFATATVLLYRKAGIPARYVTGFSVHEWSDREQSMIARKSDAHAWARVWLNNKWVDVDSTPPDYQNNTKPSLISDYFNYLKFKIQNLDLPLEFKIILAIIILAWLVIRIKQQFTFKKTKKIKLVAAGDYILKDIYKITKNTIFNKESHETLSEWLDRIDCSEFKADINNSVYGKNSINPQTIKALEDKIKNKINLSKK